MTIFGKSVLLWVGGAAAGYVIAKKSHKSGLAGAALGAMLVGGIGDVVLENAACASCDGPVDRPKVTAPA